VEPHHEPPVAADELDLALGGLERPEHFVGLRRELPGAEARNEVGDGPADVGVDEAEEGGGGWVNCTMRSDRSRNRVAMWVLLSRFWRSSLSRDRSPSFSLSASFTT
jgi:hypothetical protein